MCLTARFTQITVADVGGMTLGLSSGFVIVAPESVPPESESPAFPSKLSISKSVVVSYGDGARLDWKMNGLRGTTGTLPWKFEGSRRRRKLSELLVKSWNANMDYRQSPASLAVSPDPNFSPGDPFLLNLMCIKV